LDKYFFGGFHKDFLSNFFGRHRVPAWCLALISSFFFSHFGQ